MSHLMQPINLVGTRHCVKHGATTPKWRTVSTRTHGADTGGGGEDADEWLVEGFEGGYIEFATCCIWKATVRFTATDYIAGVGVAYGVAVCGPIACELDDFQVTGELGTYDVVVDLHALGIMGRPCGSTWQITALFAGTVQIIDVTFGPPV